jgi:PAS domain S-box-containing protein
MLNVTTVKTDDNPYPYTSEEIKVLIDLLPVGVSILDSDRKIIAMNKALETILGYSHEQLLNGAYKNRKYFNADNSEMSPDDFPIVRAIREQNIILNYEIKVVSEDGSEIWLNISASPLQAQSGTCIVITTDITTKKKLEKDLQQSETLFSEFLKYAPAYIYIKDKNMKLVKISKSMEELLGKPSHELIGKDSYDLVPSEFAKSAISDDKKVLRDGLLVKREESINNKIYMTTKFPIVIDDSLDSYLAGYSVDITELKKTEESLQNKIAEITQLNQYMIGRELAMIELKKKVAELEKKLSECK